MTQEKEKALNSAILEKIKYSSNSIDFTLSLTEGELSSFQYQPELNDVIYHYTKFSTFEKIVKNSELQGTHLRYMNDSQELKHGLNYFEDCINKIAIEDSQYTSISSNQISRLLTFLRRFIKNNRDFLDSDKKLIQSYATCFSINGDQLSQWRAYGKEGCCIGFDAMAIKESFEKDLGIGNSMVKLLRIIYNQDEQIKIIHKYIDFLINDFASIINDEKIKDLNQDLPEDINDLEKRALVLIFQEYFSYFDQIVSCFKHYSFKEEEEIRLLYIYYPNNGELNPPKTNVRLRADKYFIPYYVFSTNGEGNSKNQKLPIKEIYLSPEYSSNFNEVVYGVKILLKENGYDPETIIIKPSSSPYNPN